MEKYIDLEAYPTPYYIVYEDKLRRNLDLISHVASEAGVKIIMAFKANALWRTFGVMREYGVASTASSLNEMWLANEELAREKNALAKAPTHMKPACPRLSSPEIPTVRFRDTARITYMQSGTRSPSRRLDTMPALKKISTII